jgi:prepilin-type N-terminal cleavage/methylation domain-containing protein
MPKSYPIHAASTGFSLSELMVSLAIVGVVATLTVPTLMNNVQESQLRTKWKKTIAVLSQLTQQAAQEGSVVTGQTPTWFLDRLKLTQRCATMSGNTTTPTCNFATGSWGFVLAAEWESLTSVGEGGILSDTGAQLYFYDHSTGPTTALFVDVNGILPPNVEGKDQMRLAGNFGLQDGVKGVWESAATAPLRQSGQLSADFTSAASVTLFNSLLANS